MRNSLPAANLVANALPRADYVGRFMAAGAEHQKSSRQKKTRLPQGRTRAPKESSPKLPASRASLKQPDSPGPGAEALTHEETLKHREVHEPARRSERGSGADDAAGGHGRERTAYDGDTAIKLYLREIGQVKLLTPQEEIE